jgi:hypothetical protein
MNNRLNQIKLLMKTNETSEAARQIEAYLGDNPEDAQGWYMASFLRPTAAARLAAIKRAATLAPDHGDIQRRLVKLEPSHGKTRGFSRSQILILVILASGILVVFALILLNGGKTPPQNELPTLVVLQAMTAVPTQAALIQENPTGETISPTTAIIPNTQITNTVAEVSSEQPQNTEIISSPEPTLFVATETRGFVPATVASTAIPANNTVPLPTVIVDLPTAGAQPTTQPISQNTATSVSPTQLAAPTAISVAITGTPLNIAVDVGAGQLRVVDATRNAESLISDLGGLFPPAPADQSWMLVELLLVCNKNVPCVFSPSALRVISSSGGTYSYVPQLNLVPQFGSVSDNNQIWGYLGFTIPNSDTSLGLTLSENNQTYTFLLQ